MPKLLKNSPDWSPIARQFRPTPRRPTSLGAAFESEVGQELQADAEEFVDVGAGPRMIVEETIHIDEE